MERSKLRSRGGMRYALLDRILEDLAKEGRVSREGKMIYLSLRSYFTI